ncbi:hypothetical protein [Candidatus Mycoplasma haematohominis]|uniref:Uncharacterized protein n=1 Tax=Candidatus Mycoplasma haematohominis TaxID=1494318 RepID=A0A478FQB4_9MOLU|nr:hypothetical protein [Candidatus Mycoplasma haemohominis]GCE63502.1 hypothetical protein MHSWG343_04990 [Candidatus Mycoplasma haemohominis]
MDPLKAGAVAAAVGVRATGAGFGISSYVNTPYSLDSFLSTKDGEAKKNDYEGKLGGLKGNGKLFVANIESNKWWWEKRFEETKNQNGDKSTEFTGLTTYSSDTSSQKAINKVCDEAYKADNTKFGTDDSSAANTTKYKVDIAKYCTFSGNGSGITWLPVATQSTVVAGG